jgi:hsp70-interacting protein
MPDLNELLRWSIENSAPRDGDAPAASAPAPAAEQPLSLSFRPTSDPAAASSALHPSDPHFPLANNGPTALAPSEDVAGAAGTPAAPARRDDLTTEMLDLIMGKSDSVVMKEKMALAVDESQDVADRVDALDDFEMVSTPTFPTIRALASRT